MVDSAITARNYTPCPPGYWFTTPYCAQIPSDAHGVLMAVFTDDLQKGPTGDYWYSPMLYSPFTKLKKHVRPLPTILHNINGSNWATADVNRQPGYNMQWRIPSVDTLKS